jgi:hypothetical protein
VPWPRNWCLWPCTRSGPGRRTVFEAVPSVASPAIIVTTSQSQSWPMSPGGRTTSQASKEGCSSSLIFTERSRSNLTRPHHRSGVAAIIRSWPDSAPSVSGVSGAGVPGAGPWGCGLCGLCRSADCAGMIRAASASLAISGATDISAVNGNSFACGQALSGRPRRQRSAEGRCQQQHERQSTHGTIAATPERAP